MKMLMKIEEICMLGLYLMLNNYRMTDMNTFEIIMIVLIAIVAVVTVFTSWTIWQSNRKLSLKLDELNAKLLSIQEEPTKPAKDNVLEKLTDCSSLSELLTRLEPVLDDKDEDTLYAELDSYKELAVWIERIDQTYGKTWDMLFQQAEMPVGEAEMPAMHSLTMELALHTIDFCRCRTGYVNLTDAMKVNPMMMLHQKDAQSMGSMPFEDNPEKTPREVRALYQLMKHDGVVLKHATIHGYELTNEIQ
jgi:hypothetical protein